MPWIRSVSVWDEAMGKAQLRLVEVRHSDGLGDYSWPAEVEELPAPPWGFQRRLKMSFEHVEKPRAGERHIRIYPLVVVPKGRRCV